MLYAVGLLPFPHLPIRITFHQSPRHKHRRYPMKNGIFWCIYTYNCPDTIYLFGEIVKSDDRDGSFYYYDHKCNKFVSRLSKLTMAQWFLWCTLCCCCFGFVQTSILTHCINCFWFCSTAPPSPPQNLHPREVTSRSVTIQWEPPLSDGGSALTGYVVEKRLATVSASTKWTRVVTLDVHCLQYCIDNLKDKSSYSFRVLAENEVGLGAPAITENVVLKTHASKYNKQNRHFCS